MKKAAASREAKPPELIGPVHHRRCDTCLPAAQASLPDAFMMDHLLHAYTARLTGGLSPTALALAGFDWFSHLSFSPAKRHMLLQSFWDKGMQFGRYALASACMPACEPVVTAPPSDQRFKSESWRQWPFNLLAQGFLLSQEWWQEATTDVRGVSDHHANVVSFTARQWLDMLSPSNGLLTNPETLHTTLQEGGSNLWRGMLNALDDASRFIGDKPPAGAESFMPGRDVAVTAGKVVYRNALMELIQYAPATKDVYAEPVLIVPAWIMKYYILDLSPGNSLVKYLVEKGHTVFIISWVNPGEENRDTGFEDYLHEGLGEAITAVKSITGSNQLHAMGYCLGGTLLTIMAAAMARDGDASLKTLTLLAAQTDFEEAGEITLFVDESQVSYLEDTMWNQGYLDKLQMAGAFQMLRSNDLIWSRLITEYLQGKRRPINDLMAWNADATRMPYRMHSEYLRQLFMKNALAEGHFSVNGAPIALRDIRIPAFVVGTVRDHVAPWKSVYKIQLLVDGDVTFALTSGGHNAGIVSEPGHKGRGYQIATTKSTDRYIPPDEWQRTTPVKEGSWWEPWQSWLAEASASRTTPPPMGDKNKGYAPLCDAPGEYVMVK